MRPTISEQLRETRRIMNDVIAPNLHDGYSAQILEKLLSNLGMLERCWANVAPFLAWDNEQAFAMLEAICSGVSADLAQGIDRVRQDAAGDPFDMQALEDRNTRIQALLQRAIRECGPDDHRKIQVYLMERTARYPMRPDIGTAASGGGLKKEVAHAD
ncbi:hypothetical protein SAMN02927924_00021 [Sphingobium faniae]|nr:hypothetical protein SAMN02927924_00021 [Sphingobium faniae]